LPPPSVAPIRIRRDGVIQVLIDGAEFRVDGAQITCATWDCWSRRSPLRRFNRDAIVSFGVKSTRSATSTSMASLSVQLHDGTSIELIRRAPRAMIESLVARLWAWVNCSNLKTPA